MIRNIGVADSGVSALLNRKIMPESTRTVEPFYNSNLLFGLEAAGGSKPGEVKEGFSSIKP